MKWWGISGSWRLTSVQVESDVRCAVRSLIAAGDGIVSGGALNVDYFATDEAMALCPSGRQMKIIIPTPLDIFAAHYRRRAKEGVIRLEQAAAVITQLEAVKKVNSLVEMDFTVCTQETYYARNTEVVAASTGVLAFQVNGSEGVQDTMDKARERGMEVILKSYSL